MDERETETDGDGGDAFGCALVGRAEDDEEEEGGEEKLRDEAGEEGVAARRVETVAIGGEAGRAGEAFLAACDDVEAAGSGDAAEHLGDDVGEKIPASEASAGIYAERDSGVEMRAGDMADGEGHGEHGKAEGEGDAPETDAELGVSGGKERG